MLDESCFDGDGGHIRSYVIPTQLRVLYSTLYIVLISAHEVNILCLKVEPAPASVGMTHTLMDSLPFCGMLIAFFHIYHCNSLLSQLPNVSLHLINLTSCCILPMFVTSTQCLLLCCLLCRCRGHPWSCIRMWSQIAVQLDDQGEWLPLSLLKNISPVFPQYFGTISPTRRTICLTQSMMSQPLADRLLLVTGNGAWHTWINKKKILEMRI